MIKNFYLGIPLNSFVQTFHQRFASFLEEHRLIPASSRLLLGVSGGLDSMAMLHLFHVCRPKGCSLSIVHVNHLLRGAESDADEDLVRTIAEQMAIPFFPRRVDVVQYKNETGLSTQEAARELRYRRFEEVRLLTRSDLVATAHHADDNAETVLMNALRGSGVRGLAGIPLRRSQGNIIRPLLFCSREELRQYVEAAAVPFREDSSNASTKYKRNVLRHDLLPALHDATQSDIIASLNRVSSVMHSLAERLDAEVNARFDSIVSKTDDGHAVSVPVLANEPLYLQEEVVLRLFRLLSIEPSAKKVQACLSLLDRPTGKSVRLQKQWALYRDREQLLFAHPESAPFQYHLAMGREYRFPGFRFAMRPVGEFPAQDPHGPNVEYVDAGQLREPLILRTWQEGDSFVPLGMAGAKKLSDFFTDQKVPLPRKRKTPLLEANGDIVWVCGMRLDNRFRVTPTTQQVARLEYLVQGHNTR